MDGASSLYAKCGGLSSTTTLESRHRAGGNNEGLSSTIPPAQHSGVVPGVVPRVQDFGKCCFTWPTWRMSDYKKLPITELL